MLGGQRSLLRLPGFFVVLNGALETGQEREKCHV